MSVAIRTRFLGPTNYRGARIVATVPERVDELTRRRDSADWPLERTNPMDSRAYWSLTVPYPYELGPGLESHRPAAMALAERLGWFGTWFGGAMADGYVFVLALDPFAIHRPEA